MSAAVMIPVSSDQLRSMTTYVKDAQPIIEKQGKLDKTLSTRVPEVVDSLVRYGCLHAHLKEAKVRELTEEPTKLLDEVVKLASRVQVAPVGSPAVQTKEASSQESRGSANQVFLSTLTGANS